MKILITIIGLLTVSALTGQKGWITLFDGSSLTGWHTFKKPDVMGWVIEDGVLTTDGKGGDLVTNKEYGDFILEFDFKVSPKGNSGVVYKVQEPVADAAYFATYSSGPEFQLIDDVNYPAPLNATQKTGANYDMHPPNTMASKPAGEWNKGIIQVKKNKITHKVNGKVAVEYTYGDQAWIEAVAKSKFAKWPYAKPHATGKIALQGHNDRVYFKNIKLKEL
ncbi:MAG: DUF1080 domain-containing protein [Saprospiraceae bacterium]|nr:DUF1080 domain-containing protein [Saprospiraceae bacterium]